MLRSTRFSLTVGVGALLVAFGAGACSGSNADTGGGGDNDSGVGGDDTTPGGDSGVTDSKTDGGGDSGGDTGCPGALKLCGSACVDVAHDPDNCQSCGTKCVSGEVCTDHGCATVCPGTLKACGAACYDTQNDPKNCGDCGHACGADQVCVAGACADTCPAPNKNCGGTCTNTDFDPSNCGACGTKCAGGTACVGGVCERPVDTTDDDGDTISNYDEGKSASVDTDHDGTPDYQDLDTDGDGILDAAEAGDTDIATPPVDSDGDGIGNWRDTDSDNDGISDHDESTLSIPGHPAGSDHTDPTKPDSDGDGYTDAEEEAAGTDPLSATSNPGTIGGFSFDLPYHGLPRTQDLTFKPSIKKADVGFVIDTTGSMGGTISNVQTNLKSIATKLSAKIPDTAFAVGEHKDFPIIPYGDDASFPPADFPFQLHQRVTTVIADVQTAVDSLFAGGGYDLSEAQIEGMYQALVGQGFTDKTGTSVWTARFDPTVGYDATKGNGLIGGMGFRKDALPIIILATDATFHHAPGDTEDPANDGSTDNYLASDFGTTDTTLPHTISQLLTQYSAIGAKFMGISVEDYDSTGASASSPRHEMEYLAIKTGAAVAASGATCPNGVGGVAVPAVSDGTGKLVCPLVFSTNSSGTGVDTAIVDAISSFAAYVSFKTIWLEARDNTTTTFDETKFFERGVPVSFATPLPAGCSAPSTADLLPSPSGDGTYDSFTNVCPGTNVTFSLVLHNDVVPATCVDQVFAFKVVVIGDKTTETDSRIVTARVPGDKTLCH